MNKRFAMLRLPCSALRILKRLQHITHNLFDIFAPNVSCVPSAYSRLVWSRLLIFLSPERAE
ncbi:MAG: hypothetical protein LBH59_01460 [Planctomycetaceae bacterium]|nr:hypothetical protein [Planctomycetaceae bacterium]